MKDPLPEINSLYRLPWSKNDNPNGWVEVTTYCNMACPGCYRGCDRKDNKQIHKPLEEIKKEILELKRIRNCQTISISGGEPLMHPDILEIVSFVRKNKMDPAIFTNGKLLTKEFLIKLKKAGLNSIIMGMDSLRSPNERKSEEQLNPVRQKYADLVYSVGGIFLGFIATIDQENLSQIKDLLRWFQSNKKAELLVFILKREVIFRKKKKPLMKNLVSLEDIAIQISQFNPNLQYAAYLGSRLESSRLKWLYTFWLSLDKKILGYLDKDFLESVQVLHHLKEGRYFYLLPKRNYFISFFRVIALALFNKSFRKIFRNYLKAILKKPSFFAKKGHLQQILIINPPGFVNGKRDLCDGCPDATLYNGELVPSCLLEEVRRFGKILELTYKNTNL